MTLRHAVQAVADAGTLMASTSATVRLRRTIRPAARPGASARPSPVGAGVRCPQFLCNLTMPGATDLVFVLCGPSPFSVLTANTRRSPDRTADARLGVELDQPVTVSCHDPGPGAGCESVSEG